MNERGHASAEISSGSLSLPREFERKNKVYWITTEAELGPLAGLHPLEISPTAFLSPTAHFDS